MILRDVLVDAAAVVLMVGTVAGAVAWRQWRKRVDADADIVTGQGREIARLLSTILDELKRLRDAPDDQS